jgi:aspartate 1-decarboxylase
VPGSGDICLNGAAARLVSPGDKVIIISYADYDAAELETYAPRIVHVDTANVVVDEDTARLLAGLDSPAPRRYVEVDAAG